MKDITSNEIKHLASLSALEFSEKEIEAFVPEFNNILKFVDQIATAKLENVDTFAREIDAEDLREDKERESSSQELILSNAPKQRKGYFNVPKVVE